MRDRWTRRAPPPDTGSLPNDRVPAPRTRTEPMARHRSGSSRSGGAGSGGSRPDGAPPRTGSWPAALDAPATGPRATRGKHRHDPATTPLDLAAIARAAAQARADEHGAATGDTGGLLDTPARHAPVTVGSPPTPHRRPPPPPPPPARPPAPSRHPPASRPRAPRGPRTAPPASTASCRRPGPRARWLCSAR